MEREEIEYLALASLKPYANNPRRNKRAVAGVAESIRRYGFVNPIVIDANGEIICGHTRLLAAQKLGMREVPCIRAEGLTDEELRAYRLADNKVAELSDWNEEKLSVELGVIREDMLVFGFEQAMAEGVYQDAYDPGARWRGKAPQPGDVWLLGRHRLAVGAPVEETLDALLDGQKADLLLAEAVDGARDALAQVLFASSQRVKPGAAFYLWHTDESSANLRGACHDAGMQTRQCLVWDFERSMPLLSVDGYAITHRPCLYGWTDGAAHLWTSNRKQTTVLTYDAPADGESLAVPMVSYCIENNTRGMDIVLDPFCACGTSIIACEQNGRIARAVCAPGRAAAILARFAALVQDSSLVRLAA